MATDVSKVKTFYVAPTVNTVEATRPFQWLKKGWHDMKTHPTPSLVYGAVIAFVGWFILATAAPQYVVATISGFMLVAPLFAAGIYELSRQRERGVKASFFNSFKGYRRNAATLVDYSLVLMLAAILWVRAASIVFALSYGGEMESVETLIQTIFFSGDYWGVVLSWLAVGFVIASMIFAITAVGIPMVVDRKIDIFTAMSTSFKAVRANLPAMALWAALVVSITAAGLIVATLVLVRTNEAVHALVALPLIVTMPLLGHATWAAYRDLIR